MSQIITIGGNRLGSGKKMKTAVNDYERSNHNLSTDFKSSISCGLLYPCLGLIGNRGDTFTINMEAAARTLPTMGPLFGSFKLQVDLFSCDFRLYQAILHNNATKIGLNMSQVKLPQIVTSTWTNYESKEAKDYGYFSNSCLQKYLGMSGLGRAEDMHPKRYKIQRSWLAIPTLAYYDIYKNYYANKQEEVGYVVRLNYQDAGILTDFTETQAQAELGYHNEIRKYNTSKLSLTGTGDFTAYVLLTYNMISPALGIKIGGLNANNVEGYTTLDFEAEAQGLGLTWDIKEVTINNEKRKLLTITGDKEYIIESIDHELEEQNLTHGYYIQIYSREKGDSNAAGIPQLTYRHGIKLQKFDLENIDKMRYDILTSNSLGSTFIIRNSDAYLPYKVNTEKINDEFGGTETALHCEHIGLVTKCYQNDIFNNWLSKEWIDGENGINEVTKIAVVDDAFKIDSLLLGKAIYNMLNRVALSDGTYYSYLDVVYTESNAKHIESPVYLGGIDGEIVFEEIVQTSPGDGDPLGTLGGRGVLKRGDGGSVVVKCDEPTFIIGIASLTPRICYSQGNEWYNTELKSLDDLHKPELDGIAFQNLIGERMAWWDTRLTDSGNITGRSVIGKLPAWMHYMTNFDRVYGSMADEKGVGYMVLNRNYDLDEETGGILDATSYIDPTKYNYAFAYTDLDAQNFWLQVHFDIKSRWLGSAKQIPNA